MPEDITSQTLLPADDTNGNGGDTVGHVDEQAQETMRGVLSTVMGREFKTYQDAIKSVTETKNLVGSVGQIRNAAQAAADRLGTDIPNVLKLMDNIQAPQGTVPQAAVAPSIAPQNDAAKQALDIAQATARTVEEMAFFQNNPAYAAQREVILELRNLTGQPLAEVVKAPGVASLLEKAGKSDEADRSLSVLHSNPRIGAARDKMGEAREAEKAGDHNAAVGSAVEAVIGAYDLGK